MKFCNYLCDMVTNISTSVKRIGRKRTEKIADVVIGWCKTNMGVNRRRKSPISHFCIKGSKGPDGKTTFGWYDHEDNIIGINYTMHKTLGDLIQTIIHEYVHSMQPVATKYEKLLKVYGYEQHPLEVEARYLAYHNHYNCFKENEEIFKNILT